MPVVVGWDNAEKTIYRFTFISPWTLPQLREAHTCYKSDVAPLSYTVVSLIDMRQAPRIAPSGNMLDAGLLAFSERIPNEDIIVVISPSRLLRQTASTFFSLLDGLYPERGLRVYWVSSEPDAYRLIDRYWRDNGH